MVVNDTSVFLAPNLHSNFVLVAVNIAKYTSQRYKVKNGSRVFSSLVTMSGYFCLILHVAVPLHLEHGRTTFSLLPDALGIFL